MAKTIKTWAEARYVVTMTEAGTVKGLYNGKEYVLAQLNEPGQASFQAISTQTVVSDDAAIVIRTSASSGGVSSGQVEAAVQDALYAEQEATLGTPTGTSNALFSSFDIGGGYVPVGKLKSMAFRCGSNVASMTTEPFYLAIWERSADDALWELVGISVNTATQSANTTIRWDFEGVELHGRKLFIGGKLAQDASEKSSDVNFRGRTTNSTDGVTKCHNGSNSYAFTPQLTFTYMEKVGSFAPADHPADAVAHLTEDEHSGLTALLAVKDQILAAFPATSTTVEPETVTDEEPEEVEGEAIPPEEVEGEDIPIQEEDTEGVILPPTTETPTPGGMSPTL